MTDKDLETLKKNDLKVVRLHMKDGEIATVKVLFVSESEEDVIADLISSTCIGMYAKSDIQPAYQYTFKDIERVEALE